MRYRDGLVSHSHHRPRSRVCLRLWEQLYVHRHMQFIGQQCVTTIQQVLVWASRGSLRYRWVSLSLRRVQVIRKQKLPKSKHCLWYLLLLCGRRLLLSGKCLFHAVVQFLEGLVGKDSHHGLSASIKLYEMNNQVGPFLLSPMCKDYLSHLHGRSSSSKRNQNRYCSC